MPTAPATNQSIGTTKTENGRKMTHTPSNNNHTFHGFLNSLHRVCSFGKICLPSQRLGCTGPLPSQSGARNNVVVFLLDNLVPIIRSILTDSCDPGLAIYRVYSSLYVTDIGGLESGNIRKLVPERASIGVGSYG